MIDIGGYPEKWDMGSMFASEGQQLYDWVREIKPRVILEIGTWQGCSTSWLAAAVRDNKLGRVYSVDTNHRRVRIDREYLPFIELITFDAYNYQPDVPVDFLFEDGEHSPGFTTTILKRYKAPYVAVHDYWQPSVWPNVHEEAFSLLGHPTDTLLQHPSTCGIALWRL